MVKSSKYKKFFEEYRDSILVGSSVLLGLIAIASTLHHLITLTAVMFLIGVCAYFIVGNKEEENT